MKYLEGCFRQYISNMCTNYTSSSWETNNIYCLYANVGYGFQQFI